MKPSELNEKVKAQLLELDSLNFISASAKWDREMSIRLESIQQHKPKKNINYALFFISLAIINGVIVLFSLTENKQEDTSHFTRLQVISNELLITSN